jgi:hypothetical protein
MAPSHSRVSKTFYSDAIKNLRQIMKSRATQTFSGFLAEGAAMEALEATGAFFARGKPQPMTLTSFKRLLILRNLGPEAGGVDGCLIVRKDGKPTTAAAAQEQMGMAKLFDAIKRVGEDPKSEFEFIPFDVKYISLLPGGLKGLDYAYINPPLSSRTKCAAFYVLVFEGDLDHVALVPQCVFDQCTDVEFGIQPLTGRAPSWCSPYMVHLTQLEDALTSLTQANAKTNTWYINPTTTAVIEHWVPLRYAKAPMFHDPERSANYHCSFEICRQLWAKLENCGCKVHPNPIAPMWCDFLVDVQAGLESARIEHKSTPKEPCFGGDRAFATGRQWHFIIVTRSGSHHVCVPIQDVQFSWRRSGVRISELEADPRRRFDDNEAGVRRMAVFMREKFPEAIKTVNAVIRQPPADGYTVRAMLSSSSTRLEDQDEDEEVDPDAVRREVERSHHAKGLWWLAPSLNRRFYGLGRGVVVSLDVRHPQTTNTFVDYVWSDQDKAEFLQYHRLPVSAYSSQHCHAIAVPLQFVDLSVASRGANVYPIWMREAYWLFPVDQQKTIMIGSPTKARILEKSKVTAAYAMIPSGVTTKHSQGTRQANEVVDPTLGTGLQYFRKYAVQKVEALPKPVFQSTNTEVKTLKQGSVFFNDDTYNPLRSILPEQTIAELLLKLVSGPDDETMVLQNPQSRVTGLQITKGDYRTTLAALNQAACTHGCKLPSFVCLARCVNH